MIDANDLARTRTFDVPGARVYAVDGRDGPLAVYAPTNDSAWLCAREPCDLREWR